MPKIKVMVFEDRPEYRQQLLDMLANDDNFVLVGDSGTTWNIVERVRAANPDVVMMDLEMPSAKHALDDRAGIRAILALRDEFGVTAPATVVITHFDDDERIFEAFCAGGAVSYLTKPVTESILHATVRRAAKGDPFSSPYVAHRISELLGNPLNQKNAALLSPREYEALTHLKQGYGQQETAELMGIASVKDLLKSIYRKLGVHTLRQAENKIWYNHLNILRWLREQMGKVTGGKPW